MAGLLYHLPGKQATTLRELRGGDLAYAFERGADLVSRGAGSGPDQAAGLTVADGRFLAAGRVGYYPEKQTWVRIPGSDAWVGFYRDDRPQPTDLARDEQIPGHLVWLGDDQQWEIPVARGWLDDGEASGPYQALPSSTALSEDGEWIRGGVVLRYQALWELALRWWDAFVGALPDGAQQVEAEEVKIAFEFAELADGAVTALAANYRLGRAEASLLGLLNDQTMREVLDALIDRPTLDNWLKKKADSIAAG